MAATIDRMLTRIWLGLVSTAALAGGLHLGAIVGGRPWLAVPGETVAAAPGLRCPTGGAEFVHREPGEKGNSRPARP